ncbi:MAG TPA: PEGA domain-containing protein [Fibrobacteria bacterium]|nr:PEGA domain-containing protein [Fibrobacteria bacterium]
MSLFPRRPSRAASVLGFACAALLLQSAWSQSPARDGESAYGLLWLDVDSEKAEIALDGLYLDQGVWLISIPPGPHEIRVRKPGFKAYETRFGIASGQSLHLDVHLEPDRDSLSRRPG